MKEEYFQGQNADFTRLRDIEEKQRLLKDRVLLIGKSLVDEKTEIRESLREIKKEIIRISSENQRIKVALDSLSQQTNTLARQEDFLILQRQLDILRK